MRAATYPLAYAMTHAHYSQFIFRFLGYYPQPKDVIYGYPEVTTSGAGTERELRK
jgi:hypothetical protein